MEEKLVKASKDLVDAVERIIAPSKQKSQAMLILTKCARRVKLEIENYEKQR